MKNRRIVVVAFLLVAVLCLGVGYATVSDMLTAEGKIDVNATNLSETLDEDVYFVESATVPTAQNGANASGVGVAVAADDNGDANDKFSVTISDTVFTDVQQSVTVYVDVKNVNKTTDVNVTVGTMTNADGKLSNFVIEMTPATQTVAKDGGTKTFAITITLNTLPEEAIDDGTFTFALEAVPVTAP